MLNKVKIELDDDELQELRELMQKIAREKGEINIRSNGVMRGMAKNVMEELNVHDDFKKRDLW